VTPVLLAVASTTDIPQGEARRFVVDGEEIAVVNLGEAGFRAVSDICSHEHYHLSDGEVDEEERTIECWKHGSTFDLETGRPRTLPATTPVRVYPVTVEDERIMIEVEDERRGTDG
jgi:3-phenylpropionate/trans-cinnamate dioxygenase ferredoxin component